ncbi:hypothetical protein LCGC14_0974510 [marine sediment metagenome]|uniref:Uncharacterized protein n=1 Tax=marine sediment metagenome TaxID=412755 RepID=A0A0F9QTW5_9ZZZZ
MALDAISTPTLVDEIPFRDKVLFAINGYDTDLQTAIEIKAAPGVGKAIYITAVVITSNDADAYPYLQDEDDNILFGRFFPILTTGGFALVKEFPKPLKLATNKALELKSVAAGNVSIWVEGAIAEG